MSLGRIIPRCGNEFVKRGVWSMEEGTKKKRRKDWRRNFAFFAFLRLLCFALLWRQRAWRTREMEDALLTSEASMEEEGEVKIARKRQRREKLAFSAGEVVVQWRDKENKMEFMMAIGGPGGRPMLERHVVICRPVRQSVGLVGPSSCDYGGARAAERERREEVEAKVKHGAAVL
ncbi:hypothetical protein Mp_1g04470 [Marchantia polymorpha subsp. ruderalis]|uniref:Uncharacterized protein n=2 Tax=Marchantia polymorpha TaxID=3197 RepID=A0AAF6ALG7_MARPO|nr:hypothetical protein MARPO_0005s0160 [Marchantia polymorpha]BBM97287.1 hypothetical protein Mp_1g04470 [Marchantia polymorpha subsp. ruderalis]|eukprot:PTQ48520.1 hypothetical protein MARPO_0005s0160 [Marchantia polymorpha]